MSDRVAAFFDFDRTLVDINSGRLWIRAERRAGRLSRWQVVTAAVYFVEYYLSLIDIEVAMSEAIGTLAGQPEEILAERTRSWYRHEVRQYLSKAAVEMVEKHRRKGDLLVLLTTSSPYLSQAVCEDLRLDDYGSTAYEVDGNGLFTGKLLKPLCYGEGKVDHATRLAATHNIDLEQSYFYTDSYSDRAMLCAVKNPRVVNPDPRLRRLAVRQGWPVLEWRAPRP